MRLLEQTWSGIPGTIYTRPHILFYSSGLSLSSCDLPPPFLSLLMSSILPHLPLVSPTLFSSELLSLAVCLACDGPEAAMLSSPVSLLFFLLPCPDPAILSTHTQTHTLYHSPLFSFCLSFALYIIPVCVFSLMPFASFFRSDPYLLSSQVQCLSKTQSRHTYKEKKKKKNACRRIISILFPHFPSIPCFGFLR